jgi:hypothetical protein
MLQARRSGSNPDEVIDVLIFRNPSSRTMALEFTHPLTDYQKQTKIFLGSRARPARKVNNFAVIYEPVI